MVSQLNGMCVPKTWLVICSMDMALPPEFKYKPDSSKQPFKSAPEKTQANQSIIQTPRQHMVDMSKRQDAYESVCVCERKKEPLHTKITKNVQRIAPNANSSFDRSLKLQKIMQHPQHLIKLPDMLKHKQKTTK